MMQFIYEPNSVRIKDATSSTAWQCLASDGSGYASLAALAAAGKRLFPGLDAGGFLQRCILSSEGITGSGGGAFYVALNLSTQPVDDSVGILVLPGTVFEFRGKVYNIWFRKLASSDKIVADGRY